MGADWRTTATKYIPDGSFADGGAMRIAPVGLAYRWGAARGGGHCELLRRAGVQPRVCVGGEGMLYVLLCM